MTNAKAVYLEFTTSGAATQVILTPAGFTADGKYVPLTMYKRVLTEPGQRRTWKQTASSVKPPMRADHTAFVPLADVLECDKLADAMLAFLHPTFNGLAARDWKLRRQPIVVDCTTADLLDVQRSTTPYKIISRIDASRQALGFPEQLIS